MLMEHYFDADHKISNINAIHVDATSNPHWEFPLHIHKEKVELSLIIHGEANIYCNGHMYQVEPGDILIKNCGVLHGEKTLPENPIIQMCLSFSGVHYLNQDKNTMLPDYLSPVIHLKENYNLIHEMFNYVFQQVHKKEKTVLVLNMINQILVLLHEEISALDPMVHAQEKLPKTVLNVITYLDNHYREKIALNDLAEMHYISPYYLSRKFKEFTGYSINQYIINRRMGEAERMLIFENLSIKEIANQCGYSDLQYFYKTFKKYTGFTPIEFQQKYT